MTVISKSITDQSHGYVRDGRKPGIQSLKYRF